MAQIENNINIIVSGLQTKTVNEVYGGQIGMIYKPEIDGYYYTWVNIGNIKFYNNLMGGSPGAHQVLMNFNNLMFHYPNGNLKVNPGNYRVYERTQFCFILKEVYTNIDSVYIDLFHPDYILFESLFSDKFIFDDATLDSLEHLQLYKHNENILDPKFNNYSLPALRYFNYDESINFIESIVSYTFDGTGIVATIKLKDSIIPLFENKPIDTKVSLQLKYDEVNYPLFAVNIGQSQLKLKVN